MKEKPTILILSGIPCSGKSTYAKEIEGDDCFVISRDRIRELEFGIDYKQNDKGEKKVTEIFHRNLRFLLGISSLIILDNTFCKQFYIDEIHRLYKNEADIKVKFFYLPLWKAYLRNIVRYYKTGKFIPYNVIRSMKKSFDKIDKSKYQSI